MFEYCANPDELSLHGIRWLSCYLTTPKHMNLWVSALVVLGLLFACAPIALGLGFVGAGAKRSKLPPVRWLGHGYVNMVRGFPDIVFFLFLPFALDQGFEILRHMTLCPEVTDPIYQGNDFVVCSDAKLPQGHEAPWIHDTYGFLLALVAYALFYGAFCGNVIDGALRAVPQNQLETARAYGLNPAKVFLRVQLPQMWGYALPGLNNIWMLLIKATPLLFLLGIEDIVFWSKELGGIARPRFTDYPHGDWRLFYFTGLLVFYLLFTALSQAIFRRVEKRVSRGLNRLPDQTEELKSALFVVGAVVAVLVALNLASPLISPVTSALGTWVFGPVMGVIELVLGTIFGAIGLVLGWLAVPFVWLGSLIGQPLYSLIGMLPCGAELQELGLRAFGIGPRRLPDTDIGLCDQVVLIGSGLSWNIYYALVPMLFGFFLALAIALARASDRGWVRRPAETFVFALRGSPLFIQFFFAYAVFVALPDFEFLGFESNLLTRAWLGAAIVMWLNTSAYTAEIFYGALRAVPKGDLEAARAFGLSPWRRFRRITWPTMMRLAWPAYMNEAIFLFHATALIFFSSFPARQKSGEALYYAQFFAEATFNPFIPYPLTALYFVAVTLVIIFAFGQVNKRLNRHRQPDQRSAVRFRLPKMR